MYLIKIGYAISMRETESQTIETQLTVNDTLEYVRTVYADTIVKIPFYTSTSTNSKLSYSLIKLLQYYKFV